MLGALEVKAISRLAAKCGGEWKPLHTAVLGCLLAHRNRRSGHCWPERKTIAAWCNCSESTVDRAIARLTAWGAIERQQPRAVSGQQFGRAQYTFLFELPQTAENSCGLEDKTCADQRSRASNSGGAVRQIQAEPCVKNERAVRQNRGPNKEEGKDHLEGKDQIQRERAEASPPDEIFQVVASPELQQMHDEFWENKSCSKCGQTDNSLIYRNPRGRGMICYYCDPGKESRPTPQSKYTQRDFDERDWRKLNHEIRMLQASNTGPDDCGERFKLACQRAGISPRRGYELWEKMMA